jgi:hypothetical protein
MSRTAALRLASIASLCLYLAACDGGSATPDAGGNVDAGPASTDGGSGRSDSGSPADAGSPADTDAGPPPNCPAGPIAPTPFDCASSEPSITFGEPIATTPLTWEFVPFDDAFCMDGSATGIGVNLNPDATRLVILLEGGGACFDTLSCFGVANPNGYDARDFGANVRSISRGLFDREDPMNPLRDASFVYVPYCTGDVHGGNNEDGVGGRMQVGYRNVTAYLRRIVPTFGSATEVFLAGRSAGGLGTLVNLEQVQNAFDCTPVHVIDDAGALLDDEFMRPCIQSLVRDAWNLDAVIPAECPQCTCADGGGLVNVFPYLARRFPEHRIGLITSMEDATFRSFFGYGYSAGCNFPATMPGEDYAAGLTRLRETTAGDDNFHTFYLPGDAHTFTYTTLSSTSSAGVSLATWITQLVGDDPAWSDVGP